MELSLIVPCYNEEANIQKFYEVVEETFRGELKDFELIFVDDGSKDGTWKKLRELCETVPAKVKILSFSRNFGKESALYAGLQKAEGDFIGFIDADLQQHPQTVLEMLSLLKNNPDYEIAAACQEERSEGKLMGFFKQTFYRMMSSMSHMEFKNGASDFRLMRKGVAEALLSMPEYHRFTKGLFSYVGFKTLYIPYKAAERNAGETKWGFRKLVHYALEGIFSFSSAPLHIAVYIGLFASIFSVLYFILLVLKKWIVGTNVSGYPTIVTLILLFGGLELLCIGIAGEYIARIYEQSKSRPVFILKDYRQNQEP